MGRRVDPQGYGAPAAPAECRSRLGVATSPELVSPSGQTFRFEIDPVRKAKMLKGLDSIGETLQAADAIDTYEMKRALAQPWLEDA